MSERETFSEINTYITIHTMYPISQPTQASLSIPQNPSLENYRHHVAK